MRKTFLIAAALATGGPLYAQAVYTRPVVEPAGGNETGESLAEARRIMNAYARCIVSWNRPGVERFLTTIPGSPESNEAGSRIASSECLYGGQLIFQPSIFRGALSEVLYRRKFSRNHPSDFSGVAVITYPVTNLSTFSPEQQGWFALQNFGDCVVRARPDEVRALILTGVAGPEETAALGALNSALGACLSAGVELRFNRPILRGILSESLYRLSVAASTDEAR